jgi:hypothetical protein
VCIWFDGLAPENGVFMQGLDWAIRLGVPACGHVPGQNPWTLRESEGARWLIACEAVCRAKGVAWQAPEVAREEETRDLHVVSGALPPRSRKDLVGRSLRRPDAAVLICPPSLRPSGQALLVQEDGDPDNPFLDAAIGVCATLDFVPVVLTLAPTEGEGDRREEIVRKKLRSRRFFSADHGVIIGADVRSSVRGMIRWCHCSHVLVARSRGGRWRRWLRGDTTERLLDFSSEVGILALPDMPVSAGVEMETIQGDRDTKVSR